MPPPQLKSFNLFSLFKCLLRQHNQINPRINHTLAGCISVEMVSIHLALNTRSDHNYL